jgi:hypothetical protein
MSNQPIDTSPLAEDDEPGHPKSFGAVLNVVDNNTVFFKLQDSGTTNSCGNILTLLLIGEFNVEKCKIRENISRN